LGVYPKRLQLLSLYVQDENDKQFDLEKGYSVRLIDIKEDRLLTDIPLDEKGFPRSLLPGDQVRVGYVVSGSFYTFDTTVTQIVSDQVPMLELTKPEIDAITKVQRRKYFRVPVMLQSVLHPIEPTALKRSDKRFTPEEILASCDADTGVEVSVVDLSGGGFAFRSLEKVLSLGQTVVGTLDLPFSKPTRIVYCAEVRRAVRETESNFYLISLEFTNILEKQRDQILRYCMQRQLEIRKRLRESSYN
jgi:c-di-GMP-binding flagellar brake protein YcgR